MADEPATPQTDEEAKGGVETEGQDAAKPAEGEAPVDDASNEDSGDEAEDKATE